jgi:hypothetical protein
VPAKTLTIHLAKEGADEFDDLLSEEARRRLNHPTTQIVDSDGFGDGARLYVFVGAFHSPKWLIELRSTLSSMNTSIPLRLLLC